MKNEKLRSLMAKAAIEGGAPDTFENLNEQMSLNLRANYGSNNEHCGSNGVCDNNGTCYNNESCSGNGTCGTATGETKEVL